MEPLASLKGQPGAGLRIAWRRAGGSGEKQGSQVVDDSRGQVVVGWTRVFTVGVVRRILKTEPAGRPRRSPCF